MKIFQKGIVLFIALLCISTINSQSKQSSDYFKFWKAGEWEAVETIFNGKKSAEKDEFDVSVIKPNHSFKEQWKINVGEGEFVDAVVLRAFDGETKKWRLFYVDDIYAQSWESEMIEGTLYFFKRFTFNGKEFVSRQAWRLNEEGKIIRTIERSKDGENYEMRYYQILARK